MTSETALSAEDLEVLPRMRLDLDAGRYDAYRPEDVSRLLDIIDRLDRAARSQPATEGLRKAARSVVANAEPDIAYEGEGFVDYLVPFDRIDALRAALAATEPAGDERT